MEYKIFDKSLTLFFEGEINSGNVSLIENDVNQTLADKEFESLCLDFGKVTYISSVGLRLVLKLKQKYELVSVAEASLEVYDVFDMTGFTTIMAVEKKLTEISVKDCPVIGEGFFSAVYRLTRDMIVKVFREGTAISEIRRELNLAKQAFVLGIPTAISFDIVRVGDRLGVRFEMLDPVSLRDLFRDHPGHYEELVDKYAALLKKINTTESMSNVLPDCKKGWIEKVNSARSALGEEDYQKLLRMVNEIEERTTFVHGDCHVKNIMIQGDDLFLIDMDTLSKGHPIFELACIYATYIAFSEDDPGNSDRFLGIPDAFAKQLFKDVLTKYMGKFDEDTYNKIAIVSYAHMIWWTLTFSPENEARFKGNLERLRTLLARYNDLKIDA